MCDKFDSKSSFLKCRNWAGNCSSNYTICYWL